MRTWSLVSRVIAESTLRQTGKRSGTLPYMSPEQFLGDACTVQSDIYSFGCTLYELLNGKPPYYTGDIGYQIHSWIVEDSLRNEGWAIRSGSSS